MGISNVLADAISMGAGEYLSSKSYNAYVRKEMERETWELENYPKGEVDEMIDLFEQRGMSREDAEVVITRMAKYKQFFINLMMTEELSLPVPSPDDHADSIKEGLVMFASFAVFGVPRHALSLSPSMTTAPPQPPPALGSSPPQPPPPPHPPDRRYAAHPRLRRHADANPGPRRAPALRHRLRHHRPRTLRARLLQGALQRARPASIRPVPAPVPAPSHAHSHAVAHASPQDKRYLLSGLETTILGSACAAVAFFVGRAVSSLAARHELFSAVRLGA